MHAVHFASVGLLESTAAASPRLRSAAAAAQDDEEGVQH